MPCKEVSKALPGSEPDGVEVLLPCAAKLSRIWYVNTFVVGSRYWTGNVHEFDGADGRVFFVVMWNGKNGMSPTVLVRDEHTWDAECAVMWLAIEEAEAAEDAAEAAAP